MPEIKRALLIVNLHKINAPILAEEITGELRRRNMEVASLVYEGASEANQQVQGDICFSLGGDGTVLYAARTMAPQGIPILPINLGSLGFIAAVHPDEWAQVFDRWIRSDAPISRRFMLEITVERRGRIVASSACLNDAVISASGIAKLIRLQVASEDRIRIGHFRSDGLIVATPTGSTAYSVAAGGPILDPEIEAVIINPICPFTLSNRPMVVPAHETITVEVEEEQRSGVLLTVDGQITEPLEPKDRIFIRKAPYQALLIASDREVFYKVLRSKLNWSGGPDA
ncbi:NAD(+)/NADH kinase [Treponema sp. TIM-1]|uniref:NAD(+)/NADH kinase n=1 Tax=Treponema sp. TIM-1 TaxID=2898417 RepID=UPI0039803520